MRKFSNTICSIYRKWTTTTRWSQVQTTSIIYDNIKCAIWSKSKNYWPTSQAIQTDTNEYNMNLDSIYPNVLIGDIIVINSKQYKVINDPVPHEKANWQIDNYEIFINLTTKVSL